MKYSVSEIKSQENYTGMVPEINAAREVSRKFGWKARYSIYIGLSKMYGHKLGYQAQAGNLAPGTHCPTHFPYAAPARWKKIHSA